MAPRMLIRDPFVSVAGFRAHPTYLDLQNLRSGNNNPADQDDQLLAMLFEASDTAQNTICKGNPLQGHIQTVNDRARVNRRGQLILEALHFPVRRLLSLSYGPNQATQVTLDSPTYHVEDDQMIVVDLTRGAWSFQGSLQFGAPATSQELDLTYSYVAAYANSLLSAGADIGATSITVTDPTGIEPGDILRIWDAGTEEQVQVAASYTPTPSNPPTATSIPLAGPLAAAHTAGVHVSGLPTDAYTAVVYLVIDALQRPGPSGPSWPGSKNKLSTAKNQPTSSRMYQRAETLLRPYIARR